MTVEREDGGRLKPPAWRPVLGLVAGLVGFALSMPLGLIFAVPWLVGCVSWAQGRCAGWTLWSWRRCDPDRLVADPGAGMARALGLF